MTVIIKSDKKATVSMGNVNGINGPQDWSMFFDFENEIYATKQAGLLKQDYKLIDVVEASRANLNGAPISISKDGVEKFVTSTTEIRTALLKNGRFGLLAEDINENFFLNSSAPATQTIVMTAAATKIIASCEGTGSLTITGDIVGAPITVTADTPKTLERLSTTAACNLNIAVSGTLTHAQIELATGTQTATSKVKTTSTSAVRARELVKVKQSLFNSIIQNKSAFTVLVQTIDFNGTVNQTNSAVNRLGLEAGTDLKLLKIGGITNTGSYHGHTYQYVGSTPTNNTAVNSGSYSPTNRFHPYNNAIAINNGGIRGAFNGVAEGALAIENPFNVTDITFGYGYSSPIARNGLRGIVTKLVVYDRVLTQSEITELTKSWL